MTFIRAAMAIALFVSVSMPEPSPAQTRGRGTGTQTYESAAVGTDGSLRIQTTDRGTIVVRKQAGQSAFRAPVVSPDRTAVGAQADYPNCCTSYGIPLQLVVYAGGRVHRFKGDGLPIFHWQFVDGGTRVAFGQEPVHFACAVHYELRDLRSERLVDSADVAVPCGQRPDPAAAPIPPWVEALGAARK